MIRLLIFISVFAVSGVLSGALITVRDSRDAPEVWYAGGLFFGIMFVLVNQLIFKKPVKSIAAVAVATGAYFLATQLIAHHNVECFIGALIGALTMSVIYAMLFPMKIGFVTAAVVAGGALGGLMYFTDIDDGPDMAITYGIWHAAVGTLLSLGLKKNEDGQQAAQ